MDSTTIVMLVCCYGLCVAPIVLMLVDALAERNRLTAGVQRIADGYGGDVASFAKQLLEGKV